MKILLLYNLHSAKGEQIRQLAAARHILCKDVLAEEYAQPIGTLCHLPGTGHVRTSPAGVAFTEEMMVFCGFEANDIYQFLTEYKEAGIAPVWLKASLTEHNVRWNSLQLHNELSEEHRQVQSQS